MIKKIDIADVKLAQKVLEIQLPAYREEAMLIDCFDIPPLKDTIDSLQQCGETFYGYYLNNELCGVISYKVENSILDIHRLFVHPNHFRKGIAGKLMSCLLQQVNDITAVIVSTGAKNLPAIHFYERYGFVKTEEIQVSEHLSITSFQKMI